MRSAASQERRSVARAGGFPATGLAAGLSRALAPALVLAFAFGAVPGQAMPVAPSAVPAASASGLPAHPPPPRPMAGRRDAAKPAEPRERLDVNSARREQLKTLAYVGDAEADRIIAARPYLTSADIVSRAGIPAGIYLANRGAMVAIPPPGAARRTPRPAASGGPPTRLATSRP